ncbi:hypothetical protein BJ165DRAFT_1532448 [Panaeolus papilionaceus]|nr:hypothetical protein BJ165DRAFT_1532448 [Panaeolus papilionaceus]
MSVWRSDRPSRRRQTPSRSPSPAPKKKRKDAASQKKNYSSASQKGSSQRVGSSHKSFQATRRKKATFPDGSDADVMDEDALGESSEEEVSDEDYHQGEAEPSDEADEDEDFTDGELQRQRDEEMPAFGSGDVEDIFNDDENVEFVKRPQHRPSSPMEYPSSASERESREPKRPNPPAKSSRKEKGRSSKKAITKSYIDTSGVSGDSDSSLPLRILPDRLMKPKKTKNRKRSDVLIKKRDAALISEKASKRTSSVTSTTSQTSKVSKKQRRHEALSKTITISDDDDDDGDHNLSDASISELPVDEESEWPRVARLRLGKGMGMLKQNRHILALVHLAIDIVTKRIHLEHPWPEHKQYAAYRLEVLLKATKKLAKKDDSYTTILTRAKLDAKFTHRVGKWFTDRISNMRNHVMACARREICAYRLGKGEDCIKRVRLLMQDDAYCHPGGFVTMGPEKRLEYISESTPAKNMKFLNPAIVDTLIEAFFLNSTSSGWKYHDTYVMSLPDRPEYPEPEIPMCMLALAATAVRAAIWEMREGKVPIPQKQAKKTASEDEVVQDQFTAESAVGVYQGHIDHLEELKKKGKVTYHKLMAGIFKQAKARVKGGSSVPEGKYTSAPLAGVDTSFLEN